MKNGVYELNDSELQAVVGGEGKTETLPLGTAANICTDLPVCLSCGHSLTPEVPDAPKPYASAPWQVYSCSNSLCPCRFRKYPDGTWDWYFAK